MRFNGWTALSLVLLVAGVGFWLFMGTTYNNWTDVGVYTVGIVLIGFGAAGMMASLAKPREADAR